MHFLLICQLISC